MNAPENILPGRETEQVALGQLISACQSRIADAISGLRLSREEREDIIQTTWLRLIREQTGDELVQGSIEDRAITIALKIAKKLQKKRKTEKALLKSEETIQPTPRTPTEIYTSMDKMQGLATILGNLSLREFTCLMMQLDGNTHEEIAAMLKIKIEIIPEKIQVIRNKISDAWDTRIRFEQMVLAQIAKREQLH